VGGGPSQAQNNAANAQANLANEEGKAAEDQLNFVKGQEAKIDPFATSRLNNGLPFFNALTDYTGGLTGQSFAPAKAALARRFSTMSALPSGMKEQSTNDLNAQEARSFDGNLANNLFANEQAKNNAAALLTGQEQIASPASYFSGAMQGNSSIMNAPLASPGLGGLFGGIASGVMSKIPF